MTTSSESTKKLEISQPGRLVKHDGYRSQFLPGKRSVIVYLPHVYDQFPGLRFPVLYLHDGQNLFDPATSFIPGIYWRVGETSDSVIAQSAIEPPVIVGIYNTGNRRLREYTPSRDKKLGGGGASRYEKMLLKEIKPFVEAEYRVLGGAANTGIGGSSLGGLLTLYLGLRNPLVFGKLAVLSPSIWWNQRWIVQFAAKARLKALPKIWLDCGTKEGARELEDVRRMRDTLVQRGWQIGSNLHYEEIPGGQHNEAAWAERVGPFLQFLFPARDKAI